MFNILKFESHYWNWKLFLTLLLVGNIFQSLYSSYAIYLIGNELPNTNGLAILAQWKFVELALEVLQEAFILPMFYFLYLHHKDFVAKFITANIVVMTVIIIGSLLFYFIADIFVTITNTPEAIRAETSAYLKINIFGVLFSFLSQMLLIALKSGFLYRNIIIFQLLSLTLNIGFNALFIGGYSFSLDLGIIGYAWARIFSEVILFTVMLILFLKTTKIRLILNVNILADIQWRFLWRVIWGSGADSLVRNLAYSYMVLSLINKMGEAFIGGYYLTMHILWGFVLIPTFIISETTKALIPNHSEAPDKIIKNAVLLSGLNALIIPILLIFWSDIAGIFSNDATQIQASRHAILILAIPYMFIMLNLTADSLFYGTGRTEYMAYQSLIVNGLVFGTGFILYQLDIWQPDYTSVLIISGLAIMVDSFFTYGFVQKLLQAHKRGLSITADRA